MSSLKVKKVEEGLLLPKEVLKAAELDSEDEIEVETSEKRVLVYSKGSRPIFTETSPLWKSIGIGEDEEATGREHDKYLY